MNWQEKLKQFEKNKSWDLAIEFMQKVITENPNSLDAYLSMNYLLMNLLVEENYDQAKQTYYEKLTKKYFDESYGKFSNNAEYLFYMGIVAHMSEWYFGIEIEEAKQMLKKAALLDSSNILYTWGYYAYLDMSNDANNIKAQIYAKEILNNSHLITQINSKGTIGQYILEMIVP